MDDLLSPYAALLGWRGEAEDCATADTPTHCSPITAEVTCSVNRTLGVQNKTAVGLCSVTVLLSACRSREVVEDLLGPRAALLLRRTYLKHHSALPAVVWVAGRAFRPAERSCTVEVASFVEYHAAPGKVALLHRRETVQNRLRPCTAFLLGRRQLKHRSTTCRDPQQRAVPRAAIGGHSVEIALS